MTRLWKRGKPLTVYLDDNNQPMFLQWGNTPHLVEKIILFWQFDTRWWEARIYKNYYRVLIVQGTLMVIYHDLLTDTWAVQRVYD